MSSAGHPAPWLCNLPRRLPPVRSSGLPAIGNPRAMSQPMPLYPAPRGGRARGAFPTGPPRVRPGRQARRMCSSPRRLPSMRSSGLPAIGNPRAMPQPMPLHLTLEVGHARAPTVGAPRASPGFVGPGGCIAHRIVVSRRCASPGPPSQEANKRRRVLWHGRCSLHWRDGFHPRTRFGRARCMGRFVHRHGPTRHTRGPRLRGSPTTTLTPPLGPTTEVKRHSARRQQFDHWTRYLNAAKANLEFPSQLFAGFGAVTFPRDT